MFLGLEIGIVCGSIVLFTAIHAKLMELVNGKKQTPEDVLCNCTKEYYLDPWTSTGLLPESGIYSRPPALHEPKRKFA